MADDGFVTVSHELDVSDNEGEDERQHNKLLDALSVMDGKKKVAIRQRTEAATEVSEFAVSAGTGKVDLGDLVGALGQKTTHAALRKQLRKVNNKQKVLATPLSRPEQERVSRQVAYGETTKELAKWDPVIHKNRLAEELSFPLEKPDVSLVDASTMVKRFKANTALEREVAALLGGGEHELARGAELTPAEQRALRAMSVDEAKARRAELQRHRALLSYQAAKAHRQKKVKSKKYHRVLRKEREKKEKAALEELKETDPEAFLERLNELNKDRMQERMSLKHRGGSKKMQKQAIYKKYDDTARQQVQEMLQKSRELSEKVALAKEDSSDEDNKTDEEKDEEEEAKETEAEATGTSSNPWMKAVAVKVPPRQESVAEKAEEEDDDGDKSRLEPEDEEREEEGLAGKQVDLDELFQNLRDKQSKVVEQLHRGEEKKGEDKSKQKNSKSKEKQEDSLYEEEENEEETQKKRVVEFNLSGIDESLISDSTTRKHTLEDFDGNMSESEEEEEEPKTQPKPPQGQEPTVNASRHIREISVNPRQVLTVEEKSGSAAAAAQGGEQEQRLTIADAFAADDVIEEFVSEKRAQVDKDKPKDIDLTLPGWGDWGGAGVKPSKRKRKRFIIKAPPAAPRKDALLDNVIISETKDTSIAKHQISALPHQYKNVAQFESSIRQPLGKAWNPETAYRKLIAPALTTASGTIIAPINKSTTFKNMALDKGEPKDEGKKRRHKDKGGRGKKQRKN